MAPLTYRINSGSWVWHLWSSMIDAPIYLCNFTLILTAKTSLTPFLLAESVYSTIPQTNHQCDSAGSWVTILYGSNRSRALPTEWPDISSSSYLGLYECLRFFFGSKRRKKCRIASPVTCTATCISVIPVCLDVAFIIFLDCTPQSLTSSMVKLSKPPHHVAGQAHGQLSGPAPHTWDWAALDHQ